MGMRKLWFLPLIVFGAVGCSSGEMSSVKETAASKPSAPILPASQPVPLDRLVARTVSLEVQVPDLRASAKTFEKAVRESGGFVVTNESTDLAAESPSMTYTTKVPPSRLDGVVDVVEGLGQPLSKRVGSEDKTNEVIDIEARLKAMRAHENSLRNQLARANRGPEALDLQKRLMDTIGEIESASGRYKALRAQVDMSDLQVTLRQGVIAPKDSRWVLSAWHDSTAQFLWFVQWFGSTLIWLVVFAPLWLVPLFVIRTLVRKLRVQSPAPPPFQP